MSLIDKCRSADFKAIFDKMGYKYFTNGQYNLNIIGVRASGDHVSDKFDDVIVCTYNDSEDKPCKDCFEATTDPGGKSMTAPVSSKGCAILVPGQYRGAWTIGKHKGLYEALCLAKPVKVYRDNNKDMTYDFDPSTEDEGMFGINIHKAGLDSTIVSNWSAGCLVFKRSADFEKFMKLCHKQVDSGMGKAFTYTLLREEDLA